MPSARNRRANRILVIGSVALLVALELFLIVIAVVSFVAARHSQQVQEHGISVQADVQSYHSSLTRDRYGHATYHSTATVTYADSSGAKTTAVIHVSEQSEFTVGKSVTALIDRSDRHYGELPGHRTATFAPTVGVGVAVLAVPAIVGLSIWLTPRLIALRSRR